MASSAALESDRGRERRGGGGGALPRAYRRRERRGGASKLTRLLAVTAVGEAAATVVACRSRAVPLALKALLAHTAWVTASVALATASGPAAVAWLGKRPDGSFAWWSYALFAQWHMLVPPYYLAKRRARRRTHGEPVYTRVRDGWWIGGWPSAPEATPGGEHPPPQRPAAESDAGEAGKRRGGRPARRRAPAAASVAEDGGAGVPRPAILDCTAELARRVFDAPAYLCLPIFDCGAPTVAQLDEAVEWAAAQRALGREVLVHCANGHGRSATVLAACLLAEGAARAPADAEAAMKAVRPLVKINAAQGASLDMWWAKRNGLGAAAAE